jgi:hypothetical protein
METLKSIWDAVAGVLDAMKINFWYLLLWIAAGYIQSKYFGWFTKISDAWKTLILGSIFSIIYALVNRPFTQKATWVEFFASYIFATSLYELLLKDVANKAVAFIRGWFDKKFS